MPNIPGSQLPGCDPTIIGLELCPEGYMIGWYPYKLFKCAWVKGSPREIAKKFVLQYSTYLKYLETLNNKSYFPEKIKDTITMFSVTVILKPIFTVKLEDRTKIAEGVDVDKFLSELTKELICIKKLLPFV
jgi:hypothetical protein